MPARTTVEDMGHKQPPTPTQTDNTTALGFVTKNLQPKATKSTDTKHWFMCDRQDRNQFRYYCGSRKYNDTGYSPTRVCELFDQNPDLLLSELAEIMGYSVAQLKRILMGGSR